MLTSKFPGYVRERWNRKVLSIRRTHKRDPKLFDLLRFVEEQSMLVNDPLFSKERVKFFAVKEHISWMKVRKLSRKQLKKEVN